MLVTASKTLAAHSPLATTEKGGLLPPVEMIESVSRAIALEVARVAQQEGVAPAMSEDALQQSLWIKPRWNATYSAYKRASF